MFSTKQDAENWIKRYATRVLFVPRKIGREWRVVPLGEPLSEERIRLIEEKQKHERRGNEL